MFKSTIFDKEVNGIQLLSRRFVCGLSSTDIAFKAGRLCRKTFELSLVITLLITIVLFLGWKRFLVKSRIMPQQNMVFLVEQIPPTEQSRPKPAPPRPSVPIASEDEEFPEEATIEFTDLAFGDDPPPPPPPLDDDMIKFVPFDEPPAPVGGLEAIARHLEYPEAGRLAGIEGTVILNAQIDEKGKILKIRVIKSLGFRDFDDAATRAIMAVKWNPAKQRDNPVMVWFTIPIEFTLHL
jgi:protein TonB